MESQDLQPDDPVNHSDDQRGSHERFRRSAWQVNYGRDQHVRPGDLQGASERLLPRWGVRPLPVTAGVLLKDAGTFFEAETQRIRDHVVSLAEAAGRPVEYLAHASTHRSGTSKEARAQAIAERDGVTEGLVCVLSVVEPCQSFGVTPNRQTRRLEVVRRRRKCLHYYLYRIDPEFGWMHVRLQTWAPYEMQIYVNGREWLARQMDQAGIGYRRSDNKITAVDDFGPITALWSGSPIPTGRRFWSGRQP